MGLPSKHKEAIITFEDGNSFRVKTTRDESKTLLSSATYFHAAIGLLTTYPLYRKEVITATEKYGRYEDYGGTQITHLGIREHNADEQMWDDTISLTISKADR